ncbi:hypothetical protein DSO57_1006311 [Entomophthora muscae]|uniref:Uncharacterized protein n=1 Tax=Entomophthora muscae TaxID=34485 RepID=A0ACC2T8I4_9FUNG|nr:hypothetical protein DSO57_1006311 [Entomophthora muscae]
MLMIGIPVETTLVKFNLGALLHSIGERLPNEWIHDATGACTSTNSEKDHPFMLAIMECDTLNAPSPGAPATGTPQNLHQ